jgi:hypothetical protein
VPAPAYHRPRLIRPIRSRATLIRTKVQAFDLAVGRHDDVPLGGTVFEVHGVDARATLPWRAVAKQSTARLVTDLFGRILDAVTRSDASRVPDQFGGGMSAVLIPEGNGGVIIGAVNLLAVDGPLILEVDA